MPRSATSRRLRHPRFLRARKFWHLTCRDPETATQNHTDVAPPFTLFINRTGRTLRNSFIRLETLPLATFQFNVTACEYVTYTSNAIFKSPKKLIRLNCPGLFNYPQQIITSLLSYIRIILYYSLSRKCAPLCKSLGLTYKHVILKLRINNSASEYTSI